MPTPRYWDLGYRNMFLAEYYLLTGDQNVLHAIRETFVSLKTHVTPA